LQGHGLLSCFWCWVVALLTPTNLKTQCPVNPTPQYPSPVQLQHRSNTLGINIQPWIPIITPNHQSSLDLHKWNQHRINTITYYGIVHEQKLITTQLTKPVTMHQKNFEYFQGLKWPAFSDHTIKNISKFQSTFKH
jgi:hypothetical protein